MRLHWESEEENALSDRGGRMKRDCLETCACFLET